MSFRQVFEAAWNPAAVMTSNKPVAMTEQMKGSQSPRKCTFWEKISQLIWTSWTILEHGNLIGFFV